MTPPLHLKAPAKVNFRLDVLRRRPDGYHDLRMVMQRIDLCDDIELTLTETPGITVSCSGAPLPENRDNIVWRAAEVMAHRADYGGGIQVRLTKRIPVAAGLGGGSSDAASVLTGLNGLLGLNLAPAELMDIGLTLGADVPFFIFARPAIATGIGEQLTPLDQIPSLWLLLVNPGIAVSTAWVYQNLGLTSSRVADNIPLLYQSVDDVCAILANDLETVTIGAHPVIDDIKKQLLAAGARGALMSGSGPTVFGIFADADTARNAAGGFGSRGWFTAVVPTV